MWRQAHFAFPSIERMIVVVAATMLIGQVAASAQALPNGVAAGDVTATSAVLWARGTVVGEVVFSYGTDASNLAAAPTRVAVVENVTVPVKVDVSDLSPGTQYYYRAVDAAGASATGRFRTPRVNGRGGLRLGVSGDWRGDLAPYPAVVNVPDRDLDFFIALGDTIYADVSSPAVPASQARTLAEFLAKHNEVYSERHGLNALADLRGSTAILAMIDDHEVTNDFAGGAQRRPDGRFSGDVDYIHETELFQTALRAFHEYNPIREELYGETGDARTAGKMKLYRRRDYGEDAAVFLLDTRTYRDAPLPTVWPSASQAAIDEFLMRSFDTGRTILGAVQLEELKADLLDAQTRGATWKFVIVPEPIQNLGPFAASDRFEGYVHERTELLRFVMVNGIDNVVFVAADIHGTFINNLMYQEQFGGPQIPTGAFEVTTGAVAYAPPFGPTVVAFVTPETLGPAAVFIQLVYNLSDRVGRDGLVEFSSRVLLERFGLPIAGFDGSPIAARRLIGGPVAVHTYGWTEFEINAQTQCLGITTWGVDWYGPADLLLDAAGVARRRPRIVSQYVVAPAGSPAGLCDAPTARQPGIDLCGCGLGGVFGFGWLGMWTGRRRRLRRRAIHRACREGTAGFRRLSLAS